MNALLDLLDKLLEKLANLFGRPPDYLNDDPNSQDVKQPWCDE